MPGRKSFHNIFPAGSARYNVASWTSENENIYLITFSASKDDFENYRAGFERIANSFKLQVQAPQPVPAPGTQPAASPQPAPAAAMPNRIPAQQSALATVK